MDADLIQQVLAALERERVRYVVFGADFGGVTVSVVTPAMLYRMKKGTVRPKDHVDAERIARRFGLKDEG